LSFHPTSTVSSARAPQACCILQPTMGFTAFPLVRRLQILQSSRIAPSSSRHFHQRRCFPAVYGPRSPSRTTLRRFSLRRSRSCSLRQSEECCKQPFLKLVPARSPLLSLGCLAGTVLSLLEA
jgi:hypothetical protein